ncbi:MAG: uracil-DNA glycosylase [Rhodospirillales bacterium]|nr:uracil-DNA glycosylase [Rhodospirillales bacterium]
MELLDALRLQWEWGADEALLDAPQDRRHAPPPPPLAFQKPAAVPPAPRRAASTTLAGPEEAARIAASCMSLDELETAMRGFSGCALRDTATQLVFADGAADARLVIVGEAPGGEEDRAGKPFIGPAGQLLDQMLRTIGLDRTKVRIINTVPWRPPGNRTPTESEIALCLPFLHRQIALAAPLGLLTLGAVAAKALLGTEAQNGIRRVRGQWRQVRIEGLPDPLPCLPSYHPAYLLRTPLAKRDSWQDMLQMRAWLETQT